MKLILDGAHIVHDDSLVESLDRLLMSRGWHFDLTTPPQPFEVASIQEALDARPITNPATSKPYHMVYSVRA
jgi:hypothetical protein